MRTTLTSPSVTICLPLSSLLDSSSFSFDTSTTMHSHLDSSDPHLPTIKIHHPSSPRHPTASATPTAGARRKIGVAVDLSDESAFAIRWAVDHYIRPGDAVVVIHVSPTSVLFGADWGPLPHLPASDQPNRDEELRKSQEEFDALTASKIADVAKPLKDAQIPLKVHIVKDHDMRERLCLEVERLGLSAVIMGSRGFGAAKRGGDGKLGSVSDYCVHHSVCPVVVVRYPDDKDGSEPVVSVTPPIVEEEDDESSAAAEKPSEQVPERKA